MSRSFFVCLAAETNLLGCGIGHFEAVAFRRWIWDGHRTRVESPRKRRALGISCWRGCREPVLPARAAAGRLRGRRPPLEDPDGHQVRAAPVDPGRALVEERRIRAPCRPGAGRGHARAAAGAYACRSLAPSGSRAATRCAVRERCDASGPLSSC